MKEMTTEEMLKIKKDFLIGELSEMNLYLDSEEQIELMEAIGDVLFMHRMKKQKIKESIDFIGTEEYHKHANAVGSMKLNLIKLITQL